MSIPVLRGFSAAQADIEFVVDSDFDVTLTDTAKDGTDPRDWTGYTAELIIKDDAGNVVHTMTTENSLIELSTAIPVDGKFRLKTPLATIAGFAFECGKYRMSLIDSEGIKKPYMYGLAVVTADLSRDCP